MYKSLLFLVFLAHFQFIKAQDQKYWGWEARVKSGFLIGHRPNMGHLPQQHSFAGELTYVFRTNGQRKWHKAYKYPDMGITLFGGSVGNQKILGDYFGFHAFVQFPFVAKEHFRLNGKLGSGLGYGTKQYNEITNPKNVAISTPINAMICIGMDARYYFKRNWISIGVDMTHFSNGAFKVPNLGLNLPFLSVAYGQFVNKFEEKHEEKESYSPMRKILYGATAILSAKEVFPSGGKKYPVYALSIYARTFLKPRVGWELSADFISKQAIFGYRPEIHKTQKDIFQIGVFAGFLLPLDRFHFVLGMGYYALDKYRPENSFYHRVGFRYYLKNGIQLNCVLKSHWAKADYVEWGIGYCFNYKKK